MSFLALSPAECKIVRPWRTPRDTPRLAGRWSPRRCTRVLPVGRGPSGAGSRGAQHRGIAGLAASGVGAVSDRPSARLSAGSYSGGRQDHLCAQDRRRTARRRHRRTRDRRGADRAPQEQWAAAGATAGIALDARFSNSRAQTAADYHGVVVTYAQVASHPMRHRVRTENRRTLVIFDEIHHGGDARTWGDGIREAFGDATRRLALTGTPFRSDDSAIPFVTYSPDDQGLMRSAGRPHLRIRRCAGPTAWSARWCSWRTRARPAGETMPVRNSPPASGSRCPPSRPGGRGALRWTQTASGCPPSSALPTNGSARNATTVCPMPARW